MSDNYQSKPAVHGVTVHTIGGRLAALPELRFRAPLPREVEEFERASRNLAHLLRQRIVDDRPISSEELLAIAEGTQRVTLVTAMLVHAVGEARAKPEASP